MRILVLALPFALVATVLAVARRHTVVLGIAEHAAVVDVARRTRLSRVLGLLGGLLAAGLLAVAGGQVDALGRVSALAPAVLGAGVLLGTVVGELTGHRAGGVRRSAPVETRRVRDVLPRGHAAVLGVGTALLVGSLAAGTAWGAPDDLGRAGRYFQVACTTVVDGVATQYGSGRGPFPGSYYAVPLLAAFAVLGLLTLLALRAVVRRPRPGVESLGLDTTLRRWSVAAVLEGATVAVLGTLAPVAAFLSSGLDGGLCGLSPLQAAVKAGAGVVAPLALVGASAVLGVLVAAPRLRVEDLPRPTPGDASSVGAPVR
ncbi:hypothetical protein [Phycicoccus flavus]|uniref:hypothetical protein n=1 Tax=Phycicoccus flavus TaxID=2502783 RepID=UPI000FEC1A71|nr:hypothetical protein [Phycicoccus flavus]NHA68554.1 hypothetical protein [Phycicoccus flavus]